MDKVNELDIDKRSMELAVEEFQGIHNNVLEELAELKKIVVGIKSEFYDERNRCKKVRAKAKKLDLQLQGA